MLGWPGSPEIFAGKQEAVVNSGKKNYVFVFLLDPEMQGACRGKRRGAAHPGDRGRGGGGGLSCRIRG